MNNSPKQSGFTLIEILVVVTIITLLIAISLPAFKALKNSFESGSAAGSMISSAMASARAMAAQKRKYVGVRFQEDLDGHQYMIFIEHDFDATGLSPGFRAVQGVKPIRLPDQIRVADLYVRTDYGPDDGNAESKVYRAITAVDLDDIRANQVDYGENTKLAGSYVKNKYMVDTSTFSVVFSQTSGLIIHEVRVRNSQGDFRPETLADASDRTFNSPINIVDNGVGQFIQDDYAYLGLGAEMTRNSFIIYDKQTFDRLRSGQERYNYLERLASLHQVRINRYTGTLIEQPLP